MKNPRPSRRSPCTRGVAALLAAAVLMLGACGEDSDTGDSGQAPVTVDTAAETVASLTGAVAFPSLPAGPEVASGKKLFVISLSQALAGDVRMVDGTVAAAESLGWETVVVDGQFSPSKQAAGVRRAIAEGADGIVMVAIDTGPITAAVAEARDKGIFVVSIVSGNEVGEQVDADVTYDQKAAGVGAGSYMIEASEGDVRAIVLNDTTPALVKPIVEGVQETLAGCTTCKVEQTVDFVSSQVGPQLTALVQTALGRYPDANYVFAPYGSIAVFARQAILNVDSDARIVTTAADAVNYEYIAKGDTQVATVDPPLEYQGYLAVDELNRLFQGEEIAGITVPIKLIDETTLPAGGTAWTGDEDYAALFRKHWGQ